MLVAAPLLFLWGACVTPLSIRLSNRYRIVDLPGERKIHSMVTPRGAGIVLWLGFLLWAMLLAEMTFQLRFLATGCTAVFLSGYWDDMRSLNARVRFGVHLSAAAIFLFSFHMPPLHALLSLFWITGVTNAYNLIDGANGLCLMMFITGACIASFLGNASFFLSMASLAAGVLLWNFPQAKTFLGDGGTTLIGYLFACYFIATVNPLFQAVSFVELPFLLILAGGIPVVDTLFAIMRRLWAGKSPFTPDRGHVHHRLMDLGISPFWTVVILAFFQCCIVAAGIGFFALRVS